MYVKPAAPRSIGGVIDDGLRLWRFSFAKTWQLAMVGQLLISVPSLLLRLQLRDLPPAVKPSGLLTMGAANAQLMAAMSKSAGFWLVYLLVVMAYLVFYNAILLRISAVSNDSGVPIGQSLVSGLRLLPRELLLGLIGIGAGIVASIALGVIAAVGLAAGSGQRGLIQVAFALCLFLMMGFFATRLFLTLIALVVEDARAWQSLRVSWGLTRGYFWRCAAILTVLVIIGLVLTLVIIFLNGLIVVWLGPTSLTTTLLSMLFGLVSGAILGPLYPAVSLAVFFDLKLRKEGGDLAGRVNALAAQ